VGALNVAIVGAGRAGRVHALNLHHHVRRADVECVVDADGERGTALARDLDGVPALSTLADALQRPEVDAVVISTPTFTHAELACAAASARKHVFCEKPMALTLGECDAMIAAAEDAGVILQIGFMRRFQPEFAEARRRIDAGEIGRPMVVKSLTRGPGLPPPWAWSLSSSNGMLAEVNSHDFDSVRWLAGSEIQRVYVEAANFKGPERGVTEPDFYDNAVVSLRFASGAIGAIDGTCPADYGYDARVEVLGTDGLLVIGDLRGQALIEARDRDRGSVTPLHRTWQERFAEGYRTEMSAFAEAALDSASPEVTGKDGRAAVHGVLAANRSWQEQRPVNLAEVE
jgi:predicted dehydrogenase